MRDPEIRRALHAYLAERHPNAALVNEMGVCSGSSIVDVVLCGDELVGFEIKSPVDSVQRLGRQVRYYGRVLDRCWLVTAACHLDKALAVLPEWWGVLVVPASDKVAFTIYREASPNPAIQPVYLAALMWRDDMYAALKELGRARGLSSAPRRKLQDRLAAVLSLDELRALARKAVLMRVRDGWKKEVCADGT
jgi:hypothetical protein